jgi:hypothetical protein
VRPAWARGGARGRPRRHEGRRGVVLSSPRGMVGHACGRAPGNHSQVARARAPIAEAEAEAEVEAETEAETEAGRFRPATGREGYPSRPAGQVDGPPLLAKSPGPIPDRPPCRVRVARRTWWTGPPACTSRSAPRWTGPPRLLSHRDPPPAGRSTRPSRPEDSLDRPIDLPKSLGQGDRPAPAGPESLGDRDRPAPCPSQVAWGAVTFVQRFSGTLQSFVHFHGVARRSQSPCGARSALLCLVARRSGRRRAGGGRGGRRCGRGGRSRGG